MRVSLSRQCLASPLVGCGGAGLSLKYLWLHEMSEGRALNGQAFYGR